MDISRIPSPCFVLDEAALRRNLELITSVQRAADVQIILAFKGFAMWSIFPLVRQYLSGAAASSLNEARLCYEEMKTKAHTYAVAYLPGEFERILRYSSHITFNSLAQYRRFRQRVKKHPTPISMGLRVNPEWSPVSTALYNPASPGSRLGEVADNLPEELPSDIEGLHFHTLCESSSYDLEKTLVHFEARFGRFLPQLKWVNFGGGHLMTRVGYNVEHLVTVLRRFKARYPHLHVILEPGSAIAWDAGVLVATVLDIVKNKGIKTAVLDVSFTAHMPDTLEMPYRPRVRNANADPLPTDRYRYRLGGVSCLSGDFMEEYSFAAPLRVGQKLVFEDMIHYTMVKTTTFNGVKHPAIAIWRENGSLQVIRRFGYRDYRDRLS
ncbi:MAG: carboxynorspermidine decarboxylase [Saprospiraceae bacterium]|nr:carboxynorspermidine decarboxylase [Saprospiraceae bacterium]MDW8482786.1 carboxynorspermidine decarboxylase [Saprospiraceae bacterium]